MDDLRIVDQTEEGNLHIQHAAERLRISGNEKGDNVVNRAAGVDDILDRPVVGLEDDQSVGALALLVLFDQARRHAHVLDGFERLLTTVAICLPITRRREANCVLVISAVAGPVAEVVGATLLHVQKNLTDDYEYNNTYHLGLGDQIEDAVAFLVEAFGLATRDTNQLTPTHSQRTHDCDGRGGRTWTYSFVRL